MGLFDRSFHELLNRYQSIREQFAVYDDKGQVIGYLPSAPKEGEMGFKAVTKGESPAQETPGIDDFEAVTQPGGGQDSKPAEPAAAPTAASTSTSAPAAATGPSSTAAPPAKPATSSSAPTSDTLKLSPEDIKQQGQTGAEIKTSSGGKFASVQDRLNQQKVDEVLGKDPTGKSKFKAGTAEANLALADYYRKNPVGVTPGKPGSPAGAPAVVSPSAVGQPANITPAQFDARRAAQTGVARPNSAASATPEQATGVPAGTTPQQLDVRRAAQTGVARPGSRVPVSTIPGSTPRPASTPAAPSTSTLAKPAVRSTTKPQIASSKSNKSTSIA